MGTGASKKFLCMDLACLVILTGRQKIAAGEVLFRPGDYADKMYTHHRWRASPHPGQNVIDVMEAGELVGEMGMVENRPRNGTVTAVTDSTVLPIDRLRFATLVRQHPGFATRVMAVISTRLSRRTESEVQRQSLKRELAIGRKMQRSMLPQRMPPNPRLALCDSLRFGLAGGRGFL